MKNIIYKSILLFACVFCLQACEKDDIMFYEGDSAAHFLSTTQNHSFLLTLQQPDEVMTIPVMLVGNPVDKDLNLSYEVINDEETGYTTTATTDQYEFIEARIPAGEQQGWIKVRVKNPNLLNIDTSTLYLSLQLKDNNEIKAGGWLDYLKIKLTWSSDVVKPYSWNSMRYFICSTYSSNVYRGYIEATGLLEMYYSLTPAPDGSYWTQNQCWSIGQKFGNWVRQWNKDHAPEVYCHDDGDKAGLPIEPLY